MKLIGLRNLTIAAALLVVLPGIGGAGELKAYYSKSAVAPITAQRLQNGQISIRYHVPPESAFYSAGIDYETRGDTLRVVVKRDPVGTTAKPMAHSILPLDDRWQAEVLVPYHGEKVVLLSTDSEDQIYP